MVLSFQNTGNWQDKLSLEDYQVGDTTLEQIFLSFAKKTTSERLKITNLA